MSWEKDIEEIKQRRQEAKKMGGETGVQKQHEKGRLTLRERIDHMADPGSFDEMGEGAGSADYDQDGNRTGFTPANFILGLAQIDNRPVVIGGEDFTLKGGSPNQAGLRKSIYTEDLSLKYKIPLIRLHEGGGGSVSGASGKGLSSDPVYARHRFTTVSKLLGEVPVATAALGPVAGLPAARLVSSHFAVMCENAQVLTAGPAVVERAMGHKLTKEELGGPDIHARSGVVDNVADTEEEAMDQIKRFLSYLPTNVWEEPPRGDTSDPIDRAEDFLSTLVPEDRRKTFNIRKGLKAIVDKDSYFEMTRKFGASLITAFARLNGYPVGVIANDCAYYAGSMTAEAAQKLTRFVDLSNTFNLPIISFVDEPGFMIGLEAEKAATIRHGAVALAAVTQSRTPWASIIVHKVFGVAGAAHFGPDSYILAWPSARKGALPVEGGVAVAFGRQISEAENPDAMREELENKMAESHSAFPAAENFSYHELIDPSETRSYLCRWIKLIWPTLKNQREPYLTTMRP